MVSVRDDFMPRSSRGGVAISTTLVPGPAALAGVGGLGEELAGQYLSAGSSGSIQAQA